MQTLAFLWFELQAAQQCLRETFVESQVMPFFAEVRRREPVFRAGIALERFGRLPKTSAPMEEVLPASSPWHDAVG